MCPGGATKFLGRDNSIASKVTVWEQELQGDMDIDFILDGLRNGFRISDIIDESDVVDSYMPNHGSAYQYRESVERDLLYQIEQGYYVKTDRKPKVVSPIGSLLKDNGIDVRIIHDGSIAMNDYALPQSVKYQTLGEAVELARPGTYMAKVDLRTAYRSVPISVLDYCLTGIHWTFEGDMEPTYLIDTRLPFGSRLGPMVFQRCSQAVRRFMYNRGYKNIVVYLDDFFIVGDTYEECQQAQHELLSLLIRLGFQISWSKVCGPSQSLTFLGILINTVNCTLSLDKAKLSKLYMKFLEFDVRKRASKRQLQSLAGLLNWACQAIRGGRYFLRRILDAINRLRHGSHKCKLSGEFHKDVTWWLSFLHDFNGVVYYRRCDHVNVHTDACDVGAGMFSRGEWWYVHWSADVPELNEVHINYKEVGAIVLAAINWAHTWQDKEVVVFTDSSVAKAIINKGTCHSKVLMEYLRNLFWLSVKYNFTIQAVHLPGCINDIPDSISRLHEGGQVLRLMSLLAHWFHGPITVNWHDHMSLNAFQVIQKRLDQGSCSRS